MEKITIKSKGMAGTWKFYSPNEAKPNPAGYHTVNFDQQKAEAWPEKFRVGGSIAYFFSPPEESIFPETAEAIDDDLELNRLKENLAVAKLIGYQPRIDYQQELLDSHIDRSLGL